MKKFLRGLSQNIIVTTLVFAIVVVLNLLSVNYPLRLDLTDEQEYTLSDSSVKILKKLDDRLTVQLYYSKDFPPQLMQVDQDVNDKLAEIKAYAASDVVIERIDPTASVEKEQEVQKMGIPPLQLSTYAKDKREIKKAYMGMALLYQDKQEIIPVVAQSQNFEYLMASKLLRLTAKELPKVGVVISKEDEQTKKFSYIQELAKELYEPVLLNYQDTNLTEKKLQALIVLNPSEVGKNFQKELDDVLASGVNVFIFAGRDNIKNTTVPERNDTGLEDWFEKIGVKISENLLLDTTQNAQASFNTGYVQLITDYPFWVRSLKKDLNSKHPVTGQLEDVLSPWTNVLELDEKVLASQNWNVENLVSSSKNAFLQVEDNPSIDPQYVQNMQGLPEVGSYTVSAVLQNKDEKYGKIFVTATPYLVANQFLKLSQSNIIFLQNMVEYGAWGDDLISIRSRGKTSRPLAETSSEFKALAKWGQILGIPVLAILIGVLEMLVIRSKRKKLILELSS